MDNPYEAVIPDPVPDQAADNPYLNIVPAIDPRENALRQSMQAASRNNPDAFAKAYRTAKAAGVPLPIIQADEPGWERKVNWDKIDFKAINEHPELQEWLADYNHASIAHDSLDPLAFAAREVARVKKGDTYGWFGSVAAAAKSGAVYDVKKRASLAAYGMGMMDAASAAQAIVEAHREQEAIRARQPAYVGEYLERQRAITEQTERSIEASDSATNKARAFGRGLLLGAWEILTSKGSVAGEVQNLTGSAPVIGAGIAGGVAGTAGGPAAPITVPLGAGIGVFTAEVPLEYGAWVEQMLVERGVSLTDADAIEQALSDPGFINEASRQAALKGVGTAAVDALMAGVGGKLLTSVGKGAAAKAGAFAAESGLQVAGGAASEVAGQGLARGVEGIDWGDVLDEARGEIFGGGVDIAVGAGLHTMATTRREAVKLVKETIAAQQGWNAAQALDQVVQTVKAAPPQQRSPELMATLLQKLGGDRPVMFQPADWDKAAASIGQNPAMLAERLTGDAAAYSTAKAADAEIQVPMGKLLELMVNTENHQAFLQPARIHEMSAAQAKEFAQGAEKRMKDIEKEQAKLTDEVNKLLEEAAAEDQAAAEQGAPPVTTESFKTAVRKQVEMQLRRAGMDTMEARTAAAWFAAMNATRLERSGLPAEQLMAMLPGIIGQGRTDSMDVALDRIRTGALPTDREIYGTPLVDWLIAHGGLREDQGELAAMDARLARPGLVNNKGGMTLDDAAQMAAKAGYLVTLEDAGDAQSYTPNALLNALRDEFQGRPSYSTANENADMLALREELLALERDVQALGVDIKTASNEEIKRALEKRGQEYEQAASIRRGNETLRRYGLEPGKKYNTRDVAAALEARQREKYGTIAADDRSDGARDKIAKWIAEEVRFEMENPGKSGVGWYSAKFQRALDVFAGEFPELKTDQEARGLLTALIAITSDGQKVVPNFTQAVEIYSNFRKSGKFTTERGHIRQGSIAQNLEVIQALHDKLGAKGMREYLLQERTVSELKKLAKESGQEISTDYQAHIKLPLAALVFGPKLGAFYANLMGADGYLTMDRWWSRTFNRYRGGLLQKPTRAGLDRFKQLLGRPEMSDDEVLSAIVAPQAAYEAKGFKNGTEIEKAANTIYKAAFVELEDAPFNATDRTFMLDAVKKARANLARSGISLSVADIQAILWYFEKRLYGDLGARQSADISYEEAAQRVIAERAGSDRPAGSDIQPAVGEDPYVGPGAAEGDLAQPAYHGTGNSQVYDRFRYDLVGGPGGEGAQAYGWGLYFASKKAIAAHYREANAMSIPVTVDGTPLEDWMRERGLDWVHARRPLEEALLASGGDVEIALDGAKHMGVRAALQAMDGAMVDLPGPGRLYTVEIPEDSEMLDWDKPLKDQPAHVQKAIEALFKKNRDERFLEAVKKYDAGDTKAMKAAGFNIFDYPGAAGGLYKRAAEIIAEDRRMDEQRSQKAVSDFLRANGIPGMAYTGESSQSRNYVIFDDSRVAIQGYEQRIPLYRGVGGDSGGGNYYSVDREFARNFTRSGLDSEIMTRVIDDADIYDADSLPFAGDVAAVDAAIAKAVAAGKKAVRVSEGKGQPESVFVFDKTALGSYQAILEQPQGNDKSGGYNPWTNVLTLFKARDRSTFFHETGHWYLETQQQVVDALRAIDPATLTADQQGVIADWEKLLGWLGVDEATWRGMDLEARRPFHEKMAAATEGYLMEGKAPSKELRSVFARVAGWLATVYRNLKAIIARARAPEFAMDDDIRGILDRVLATDQEIAEARSVVDTALPDETPEIAKLREEARQEAEAELRAEVMDEISRDNRKAMLAARKAIEPEVRAEVAQEKVYRAIDTMQGKVEGIDGFKLNLDLLKADYRGSEVLEKLKKQRVTTSDGGVDAKSAAMLLGFASGDELVMALANAENRERRIRRITDERVQQRWPSLLMDKGALSEAAMRAVHNERRSELLMREIELLANKVQQETKAGLTAGPTPAKDAALRAAQEARRLMKQQAEQFIAGRPIRQINPNTYLRAERKAALAATDAAAAGRYAEALRQKRRQMLNAELYRAAMAVVTGAEKVRKYMVGVQSEGTQKVLGKAGQLYLDRADEILEGLEFKNASGTKVERRKRLAEWLARTDKDQMNPPLDEALIDRLTRDARTVNYRDLTWTALQEARDAMQAVVQQARMKDRFLKNRKLRELAEARIKIVGAIEANVPKLPEVKEEAERTRWDKWAAKLRSFGASMRMLSSYARQADGGQAGGWVWEYLVRPLNEAADAEVQMRKEAARRVKEYGDAWAKAGRKMDDRVMIPEIGKSLNLESRIMVALNWGNADNRQRVMDGHGWSESQVRAILDTLEREDWVFVQSIWDHINSYWPEIAAKERRVTGVVPEKVEAVPVQTKFGEFAGGYFPIIYDPAMSARAGEKDAEAQAKLYFLGDASRASTKRNHVLERGAGMGKPLRLSLNVVDAHLAQVIHDLTHHEAVIDMNRVLGDEEIAEAIRQHLGPAAMGEMRTLVKNVALSDLVETQADKFFRYLRSGASIATMGFSLSTVMMQATGVGQSMQLVGSRPFGAAVARFTTNPIKAREWINGKSAFMSNREQTALREAREVLNQIRGSAWKERLNQWAYYLMLKAQGLVDAPTWMAAYDNAVKGGRSDADAVAMADQAVIDTQGSGLMKDLSPVQRGRVSQLFTVYYSYFNVTYNRTAESFAEFRRKPLSPGSVAHLASDMLLLYSLPAVLALGVRSLMGTGDDDDDLGTALVKEHLSVAMGTVVGLRELSGALVNDYAYRGPAGTMAFSAASKLIIEAKQGELDKGLADAALSTVGVWAHLPVAQVKRLISGMEYLDENPQGDVRAVLFGPPPK